MAIPSGVYTLFGAAVAFLGSGGVTWAMTARADRRRAKVAKRLVSTAMRDAGGALYLAWMQKSTAEPVLTLLTRAVEVWEANEAALAEDLSVADWRVVRDAIFNLRAIRDHSIGHNEVVDQTLLFSGSGTVRTALQALDPDIGMPVEVPEQPSPALPKPPTSREGAGEAPSGPPPVD